MRRFPTLACISIATLVSACGGPSDGYYDADGRYVYSNSTVASENAAPFEHDVTLRDHVRNDSRTQAYHRRGYYDYNGNYSPRGVEGVSVPRGMFPARGMCRVWFADREDSDQPPVESCKNIRARVPAGAYVIYGG